MRRSSQLVRAQAGWLIGATLMAGPASAADRLAPEARGYRVLGYRWDAVLLQRWAVLEEVAHPERPLWSERVESTKSDLQAASPNAVAAPVAPILAPVIRPGDLVALWSEDGNVRLQLGAVSQQNGAIGERIKLRVTGAGVNGNTGWQALGIVRGPGSVEMER